MSQMKLEDLINTKYLETDLPELLITENSRIENVVKYIIEALDDNLKKSFKDNQNKQKEFIGLLEEDYGFIEKLTIISENILQHIINDYGELEIIEKQNNKINSIWKFTRSEVNNLDKGE